MTLQRFQELISQTPVQTVRRAMAVALAAEAPRTPAGYLRFYCRVLRQLVSPSLVSAAQGARPNRLPETHTQAVPNQPIR